jgi:ankyrin repeat protein
MRMFHVQQGNNALHYAARQGHLSVVIYLYENGFILDSKNKVRFEFLTRISNMPKVLFSTQCTFVGL